jgi:hypothetical protein
MLSKLVRQKGSDHKKPYETLAKREYSLTYERIKINLGCEFLIPSEAKRDMDS